MRGLCVVVSCPQRRGPGPRVPRSSGPGACRRTNGESVEDICPNLIIPTGKRKGQHPSLASIYRAPAAHEKQAHTDFAMLQPTTPTTTSTTTSTTKE